VHVASAALYDRNLGIWLTEESFNQIQKWKKLCEEESKSDSLKINEPFLRKNDSPLKDGVQPLISNPFIFKS
jgi:hypothetical protein